MENIKLRGPGEIEIYLENEYIFFKWGSTSIGVMYCKVA